MTKAQMASLWNAIRAFKPLYDCFGCGRGVCSTEAFCAYCGTENLDFDAEDYKKFSVDGETIEVTRQTCHLEHNVSDAAHPDEKFCAFCGETLRD